MEGRREMIGRAILRTSVKRLHTRSKALNCERRIRLAMTPIIVIRLGYSLPSV